MYLASFDLAGKPIVQARVALSPVALQAGYRFRSILTHLIATLPGVPDVSAAIRIVLHRRFLSLGWIFTTGAGHEKALRRFVSALTRIERYAGVGVGFAFDATSFDQLIEPFSRAGCRTTCSGFTVGDVSFACSFRVFTVLDRLFSEAAVQGIDCAYQAHLAPNLVTPAMTRSVLQNVGRMNEVPGVRSTLVAKQAELAHDLTCFPWLLEEYVGTCPEQSSWLASFLRRLFNEQLAGQGFGDPRLAPSNPVTLMPEIESGLHRVHFEDVSLDERCGAAIDEAGGIRVLSWTPDQQVVALLPDLPPDTGSRDDRRDPCVAMLSPPHAAERFVFVSYAHADNGVVAPVVQSARGAGIDLWWDHQIPGGIEWDSHLEEKIEGAKGLIVFLSQAAIDSKYVRREVKYADAIGKPILGIEIGLAEHRHGMAMLLNQYQRVSIHRTDLLNQIRSLA